MSLGYLRQKVKSAGWLRLMLWGFGLLSLPPGIIWGVEHFTAQAGFVYFYPSVCVGDWERSNRAAGEPDLRETNEARFFTEENSAVLRPLADRQVFCGSFAGGDESVDRFSRVKLHLTWAFKEKPAPDVAPVSTGSDSPSSAEAQLPAGESLAVPDATGSEAPVPSPLPEAPVPSPAEPDTQSAPPISPAEPSLPPETPPPTPPGESVVPPPPPAEPAPQSGFFSIPVAHAEEGIIPDPQVSASLVFNGISGFLSLEFSLDGKTWLAVTNSDLELPVYTREDMESLQIRIRNLRTGEELPDVYLDGMWIEALAAETIPVEIAPDIAGENRGLLAQVADVVSDAAGNVAEFFGFGDPAPAPAQPAAPDPAPSLSPPSSPPPPKIEYRIELGKAGTGVARELLWWGNSPPEPVGPQTVRITPDGERRVLINGSCGSKYFVILLFANAADYLQDPSLAVFNRAGACLGGRYEYELSGGSLPGSLEEGTYYLLTAEQNDRKFWAPTAPLQAIYIKKVLVP